MTLKGWWMLLAMHLSVLTSLFAQQLVLDGITTVNISCRTPMNEVPVTARIFHTFPSLEISEVADTISAARRQIWLHCPNRSAQESYIDIHDKQLPLLMIPGDTIYIRLSGSATSPKIEVGGKTKDIQEYYMARAARFPVRVDQLIMDLGLTCPDLKTFQARADSLYLID